MKISKRLGSQLQFILTLLVLTSCLGCGARYTAIKLSSKNSDPRLSPATSFPITSTPTTSIPVTGWGQPKATMTTTVEFTTPEYAQPAENDRGDLMSANELTPVCHFKGSTYFVWTDTKRRTQVTKITNGRSETFPLDPGTDYTRTTDGHGRYSLGVDLKGYIHITGDMHNYTEDTVAKYVPRYQKQTILYWKSRQPESVSGGFAFVGGKGASTAIPGTGWTYGRFFTDNNGELFYSARVKALDGGHYPGEIGLGIYRYNLNSSTWTALGGLPDPLRTGTRYKVVVWEVGGFAPLPHAWFQGMLATVKFDRMNRMHVATSINTDTSLTGNNRVVYAMSPDGGTTWTKANGEPIRSLPIHAVDGDPDRGDIVVENRSNPNFGLFTSVLADADGKPGVLQDKVWRVWNGSKWVIDSTLIGNDYRASDFGNSAPNGSLILTVSYMARILHVSGFGRPATGYDVGDYKNFGAVDEYGLRTTGAVYGVAITPGAKRQMVLKITATPAQ